MLDGELERPDPASHCQPSGVHGSSLVVNHHAFSWNDQGWSVPALGDLIMYELHIGTFTPEGTLDAALSRIPDLKDLGVNAIEIMPVAQFPGTRNWGYDGTCLFAVQNSYGGPEGLKRFVNACHMQGLAVILDVVYNHLGPEGNYLSDYGPYFTDKYRTPWGMALNFDDAHSDEVRNFFIENALHWFRHYHIDALRLDAIHGISDMSAYPFLRELADKVRNFSALRGNTHYLIAESDLNDTRVLRSAELGGYGLHAQWCDDFHHSLHTLLTDENDGYYMDFGTIGHLEKSFREGFVYSGDFSMYRKRRHGSISRDRPADQFVVFSQNHDQTGNRIFGDRLARLASFESLKLAAGSVLLSPYIPLLFMGEEYGEDAPFLYFVDHSDKSLIEAVRTGRKEEFKAFLWEDEIPDPHSAETFHASKLSWEKREEGHHKVLREFYKQLISIRRTVPAVSCPDRKNTEVVGNEKSRTLMLRQRKDNSHIFCIFNYHTEVSAVHLDLSGGNWSKLLDSSETQWNGPGSALPHRAQPGKIHLKGRSVVLYIKENIL
jgi:maltooligosyltrehalose trehalohydrolase